MLCLNFIKLNLKSKGHFVFDYKKIDSASETYFLCLKKTFPYTTPDFAFFKETFISIILFQSRQCFLLWLFWYFWGPIFYMWRVTWTTSWEDFDKNHSYNNRSIKHKNIMPAKKALFYSAFSTDVQLRCLDFSHGLESI